MKESKRKSFKLPQMIPVVFYDGKGEWNAPVNFIEKVDVEEDLEIYVPNFEYHIFSVKERNALAVIIGMERENDVERALSFAKKLYGFLPESEKGLIGKYAKSLALGIAKRAGSKVSKRKSGKSSRTKGMGWVCSSSSLRI